MRMIDEKELLKALAARVSGARGELERLRRGDNHLENREEAIGYYEGRIDAWEALHRELSRELAGESLAPRFFAD